MAIKKTLISHKHIGSNVRLDLNTLDKSTTANLKKEKQARIIRIAHCSRLLDYTKFSFTALFTISMALFTPSFFMILKRCVSIVRTLLPEASAISLLCLP
jgi:hypothetical protein